MHAVMWAGLAPTTRVGVSVVLHLWVMSIIIVHANLHPIGYIYIRIFPTHCACQRIKCKKERWRSPWLLHDVKDRPFAEGSRGCHALLGLDTQNLNAKERHFILPLVIWTFIMQSVAFITFISHNRIKLIFSALISRTYLESNFYCLQHDNLLEGSHSIHR